MNAISSRQGSILYIIMTMLALLSVAGGTAAILARTDLSIAGNYKERLMAANFADAGLEYVKHRLERDMRTGAVPFGDPVLNVNYTAPTGYSFDPVTRLVRLSNTNAYVFSVTGRVNDATVALEGVLRRKPLLQFGVFGDNKVDMKASSYIYSYFSSRVSNPTPADSTGSADVASNGAYHTDMNSFIDGTLGLGASSTGVSAIWDATGDPIITGEAGIELDRIDPDPMGLVGGELGALFDYVVRNNDNDLAAPYLDKRIKKNLEPGSNTVVNLPAGNYYVQSLILMQGVVLNVDARGGPVNIFIEGYLEAKQGSQINILGDPTQFSIFARSNQDLIFKNDGVLKGLVYAPLGNVTVMNSADVYGLIWGNNVEIKNSGNMYIDLSLVNARMSEDLMISSWKELR